MEDGVLERRTSSQRIAQSRRQSVLLLPHPRSAGPTAPPPVPVALMAATQPRRRPPPSRPQSELLWKLVQATSVGAAAAARRPQWQTRA